MNPFTYNYPVKIYFGEKAAANNLAAELAGVGTNVMLAYGGGSIKKNGIYDELMGILKDTGKTVTEFTGIMPNPTYAKVQEGAALAKEKNIDFILAVGGGSVIDCCKIVSAQAKLDKDIWELEYTDHKQPTEFIPMGAVVERGKDAEVRSLGCLLQLCDPGSGLYYDHAYEAGNLRGLRLSVPQHGDLHGLTEGSKSV